MSGPLLASANVIALLRGVAHEPRTNWPVIDGIPWRPFCGNRQCSCFLPDLVACDEYSDGDDGEGLRRCGLCGWTEQRHPGPQRIQRQRTKGWRVPEGAVYVGRPTVYGNQWTLADARAWDVPRSQRRQWVVDKYRRELRARGGTGEWDFADLDRIRRELAGRDLACWCPLDQACHADVLLHIANGGEL